MKRKYNVISQKGVDVSLIDADLVATTAKENIPDRQVGIHGALKRSKRVTTFLLTDDEAENLRLDDRVLDVELDISEREDVSVQYGQISTHDFDRNANNNTSNLGNWGLKRHTQENLDNYSTAGSLQSGHETLEFELSGDGVDIIIWDTGLDAKHPDFNDANGRSRVQKINWGDIYLKANNDVLDSQYDPVTFNLAHQPDVYYRDFGGHGTSCASIAAGLRFGMAKKAHIYLARQNEYGLFWQTQLDWLDTIIYWHEQKDNNRPTIINNSWGYVTRGANYSEITSGRFRLNADDDYTIWNNNNFTDEFISNYAQIRLNALNADTGINNPSNGQTAGEKNLAFDTLLQEAIDAGIHVFNAAGNFSDRIVKPDHHEYDNFVTVVQGGLGGGTTEREIYYNRGGSPYSEDAFHIGAIEATIDNSTGTKKDDIIYYSGRGQAVDMYCATNCASAASSWRSSYDNSFTYPDDSNYLGRYFGGTSCATPNAVGVAACYLSANPNLTPAQLKTKILDDSKSDILFERSGSWNSTNPFLDSNNTIMYNRYNQNVGLTTTNLNIQNVVFGNPKHSSILKGTRDNSLKYIGYNVLADYNVYSSTSGFLDNDVSAIYENGKILSLYAVYNGNNIYTYTLKFDGSVYNGGWNWIQITRDYNFTSHNANSLKLYRKNATWDHVKKEFSWAVNKVDERKASLFGNHKLVIN